MLIDTGANGQYGGNEEGNVGTITLKFEHFPDIVYTQERHTVENSIDAVF